MTTFDPDSFRENIRAQFEYIARHEARDLVEEVLTELVRDRLEKLTTGILNELAEDVPDVGTGGIKKLGEAELHISPLDINHRALVRNALKREMAKVLKPVIEKKIK